ncbi:hypothetical protein ACF0H5_001368 [Mactra antiquata]
MALQQVLIVVFSISPFLFPRIGEPAPVQQHDRNTVNRFKRNGCLDSPIPYDVKCHNSCPPSGSRDWELNAKYLKCNDSFVYHCRPDQNHNKIDGCARRIGCFNGTEAIMYKENDVYKLRCDPCKDGYFNVEDHYSTSEVTCKKKDFCKDQYIVCDNGTLSTNKKCACNHDEKMKPAPGTKENCQFKDELSCVYFACPAGFKLDGPPNYECIRASVTSESPQPSSSVTPPVVTLDSVTVAGKALGENCSNVTECSTEHAVCDSSICTCPNTTYRSNKTCLEYVKYNGSCKDSTQCSTIGSICLQMRCVCEATLVYKILNDECVHMDENISDEGLAIRKIVFIVAGCVLFVVIVIVIILCICFHEKIKELWSCIFPCCCKKEDNSDRGSSEEREMIPMDSGRRNSEENNTTTIGSEVDNDEEGRRNLEENNTTTIGSEVDNDEEGRRNLEENNTTTIGSEVDNDEEDPERNREFLEGSSHNIYCKEILNKIHRFIIEFLIPQTYTDKFTEKYAGDMTDTEQDMMRDIKDMLYGKFTSSETNRKILELAKKTGVNGYYKFKGCLDGHLLERLEEEENNCIEKYRTTQSEEKAEETTAEIHPNQNEKSDITDESVNSLNSGENQEDPKETDTLMNGLNSAENQEDPKETDTLMNGLYSAEN